GERCPGACLICQGFVDDGGKPREVRHVYGAARAFIRRLASDAEDCGACGIGERRLGVSNRLRYDDLLAPSATAALALEIGMGRQTPDSYAFRVFHSRRR